MTIRTTITANLAKCELALWQWSVLKTNWLYRVAQNGRKRRAIAWYHDAKDDDIYVVSYPKSGTTAMQMMLYQLTTAGGIDFSHITKVSPWFEVSASEPRSRQLRSDTPRIYKTHSPFLGLPSKGRFIYLVRNPKDACVSYYYHHRNSTGRNVTSEGFAENFLKGDVPYGSWFTHLAESMRRVGKRRFLLISYDELTAHPAAVLARVARFCGYSLAPAKQESILYHCSFAVMQSNNDKFDPFLFRSTTRQTPFIRAGLSGSWTEELTPAIAEAMDAAAADVLRSLALPGNLPSGVDLAALRAAVIGLVVANIGSLNELHECGGVVGTTHRNLKPGDVVRLKVSDSQGDTLVVDRARVVTVRQGASDVQLEMRWGTLPRVFVGSQD